MKKLATIILLLLLTSCGYTSVRQHPSFANSWNKQYKVAVLPPEAEVTYIQFDGDNKRLTGEEENAKRLLTKKLPKALRKKGYVVRNVNFENLFARYPNARFELEKIRSAHKAAREKMYSGGAMQEEEAFAQEKSIGSAVNLFADYAGVDILVLSKYMGFEKSGSVTAAAFATDVLATMVLGSTTVEPDQAASLQITLIDGTNGNILWTDKGMKGSMFLLPDATPEDALEAALTNLPDKRKPSEE